MRTKSSSKKKLTGQAADLVEQVQPHVDAARDRIVNDYLPVAQSVLAEARDAAREVAADARVAAHEAAVNAEKSTRKSRKRAAKNARTTASKTAKKATEAAKGAAAAAAAAPVGAAVMSKVRPEPKPKHKLRFVLLLGLAGLGAVLFKKLRSDEAVPSSYTPPRPAPSPAGGSSAPAVPVPPTMGLGPDADAPLSPATVASDDVADAGPGGTADTTSPDAPPADKGGSFLDEVAADADDQPHPVTTPDNPAEVEDVSGSKGSKKS